MRARLAPGIRLPRKVLTSPAGAFLGILLPPLPACTPGFSPAGNVLFQNHAQVDIGKQLGYL